MRPVASCNAYALHSSVWGTCGWRSRWPSYVTWSQTRSCRCSTAGGAIRCQGQSSEGVRILTIWARTRAGRPLVVGLRKVSDTQRDWWIVGARDISESEHALFEQWETKAGDDHD